MILLANRSHDRFSSNAFPRADPVLRLAEAELASIVGLRYREASRFHGTGQLLVAALLREIRH